MENPEKVSSKRLQKISMVLSLNNKLSDTKSLIVIRPEGLTVQEITKIRRILTKSGVGFLVTKNTLAKKALENTIYKNLQHLFSGPTAIAYSKDMVAAAKNIVTFAKENDKIKILGGVIDNKVVDIQSVEAIANLPSLNELRAKIIGSINTPAINIARVIKTPPENLVRVFSAFGAKE